VIYYPKGKKERKGEYSEVYFRLDGLRTNAQIVICYYYGVLSINKTIEQRMYVDKCPMELGYFSPRFAGLWMEAKTPFLRDDYLQSEDNTLILYFKGTIAFEREGVRQSLKVPAVNKDYQFSVPRSTTKISSVSASLIKDKSDSEDKIFEILKGYSKWSTEVILENDSMFKAIFQTYKLDQVLNNYSSDSISVNSRNVAGVLLASDICEDEAMKNSCFKFIKHVGTSILRSYNIVMLQTYAPDLHNEMLTEVCAPKKSEDSTLTSKGIREFEQKEPTYFASLKQFLWVCVLCLLLLFALFYVYFIITQHSSVSSNCNEESIDLDEPKPEE